jgi:hypothetical protein
MWLWDDELQRLGFRRRSDRYWRCERRFGLAGDDHLSVFSWSEQAVPGAGRACRFLVELTEFHVTFHAGGEHLHFYYHERADNEWAPEGHTSGNEVRRAGCDLESLRAEADAVARDLVEALGGVWRGRYEG